MVEATARATQLRWRDYEPAPTCQPSFGKVSRVRRWVALFGLALALVVLPAQAASAHAELLSSNPTDGSISATAPTDIRLTFSEGVVVQPDGVRVLDAQGNRVDRGTAKAEGSKVSVPVDAQKLGAGSYLVAWRVISADSHPVNGAFTFSLSRSSKLSSGLADSAFAGSADQRDEVIAGALRIVAYVGALLVAGLVAMGAALRRDDEPSPVGRHALWSAVAALVALVLQIPVQGSLATGQGLGAIGKPGVLSLALGEGVGLATLVTAAGLVAIAITAGLPFTRPVRAVAVVGAVLTPLGFALTGHTRTMSPAVIGYAADVAHLAAGAAWFGGLVALLLVIRLRRQAGDDLGAAGAVARFSGWAAVIVALVVVGGTTMGWIEVGGWTALTTTTYGRVLLVKVGVVLAVLAGAAWNRYRLVPMVTGHAAPLVDAADEAEPEVDQIDEVDQVDRREIWPSLVRAVRFEAIGLVAVLALTGVLVNITPARTAVGAGIVTTSAKLDDGSMQVIVDPARTGRNDIHVYLLDKLGRPDDKYPTATFELSLPAQDIGPLRRTPVEAGPGHFQVVGVQIAPAGEWTLTVSVKPDRFTETEAKVSFKLR